MVIAHKIFISKNLSEKLIQELKSADLKIELNKFIIRLLLAAFVLSFIILLIFFRDEIRFLGGSSFTKALFQYWLLSLFISILVLLFFAYSLITLRKLKRKKEVENVLVDYLQLVSANLNAGMPIDQALWYAVRERFGILAEEIEIVARKTLSGIDLEEALIEFSQKYDSDMLKKAVVLLIEGMRAGGELAGVVNKIAWSVKEDQILNKELSAEVTTYSIFIIFAALFAAPLLYALANRIIIVMAEVTSKISIENIVGITTQIPIRAFVQGINATDFKVFSFISLGITNIISAMLVSAIKKGSIKAGLKLIPLFLAISYIIFLTASVLLTQAFQGIV